MVDVAYCQYDFWDFGNGAPQTFTTGPWTAAARFCPTQCSASAADTIECEGTSKPVLDYEFIHSIDKVTQEFIDFLSQPLEVRLFVSPDVVAPKDKVGTTNGVVVGVPPDRVSDAVAGHISGVRLTPCVLQTASRTGIRASPGGPVAAAAVTQG